MKNIFKELFSRELEKLKNEINLYPDNSSLWLINEKINNSGGNLCQHILGNLNHFIGANLGKSGYIRKRELEFTEKSLSKNQLMESINKTKITILNTLENFPEQDLISDYPENIFDKKTTISFILSHLLCHLNYHLGQINYHRRLFT